VTYVTEIPIGNGSRLAGPFVSYAEAQEFADEMGGTHGLEVRRLVSPALARALVASVETTPSNTRQEES
jgi:hypothetical protein